MMIEGYRDDGNLMIEGYRDDGNVMIEDNQHINSSELTAIVLLLRHTVMFMQLSPHGLNSYHK